MGKRFVGVFLFSASNPNRRGTPSVWVVFVAWYDAMLLTGHDRGVVATLLTGHGSCMVSRASLTSWRVDSELHLIELKGK
jgi:hypothetical protein